MEDSKNFDLDTIMSELSERLDEIVDNAISCAVQDVFPEAFGECLPDFEFVLSNGTVVRPRQRMKLLSPDKSKLVLCYGGLRVDGTSLMVQTRISSWERIAYYQNREEAIEALSKVKNAMEADLPVFEL